VIGDGEPMKQSNTNLQPKKDRVPPLSIQYDKGRYAFIKGWISNPYPEDDPKGLEWQRGFNAAYFDNIDRLKAKYERSARH